MCLLIVLSRVVPGAPLVLAGNRDERFDRPAAPMAVLRAAPPRTLGGQDLVAGGTWLAANADGVVAGLTNRPSPAGPDRSKRSRGELPLALTAESTAERAVSAFTDRYPPTDFNPAWLLVGDRRSLFAIDMTGSSVLVAELPPGIHVLENHPLGEASTKVDRVRAQLDGIEELPLDAVAARLRTVMADHLPSEATVGADAGGRPTARCSACVHTPEFGTRWSGLVTVPDDEGKAPTFAYTDGPPCRHPFVDASRLWD